MQHHTHFALGWCSCGLQVPLCNNFRLCCYFCSLWMSSWHIHDDYYAKYLVKLQCSLLFLLIQDVQHASRYKTTPSFNRSLVRKKKLYMQAADKKGRLLKHSWSSGSSCLPKTQHCFQSLRGLHFLLQAFEAKTLDSRPQVLSPQDFGREREKGWYLMGRWPPKEMTELLQHLWEIPQSHHCFTTNVVIMGLELVSYGKRILLCLNQNENYTISSLSGTTFRQARGWEIKPVSAYGPETNGVL